MSGRKHAENLARQRRPWVSSVRTSVSVRDDESLVRSPTTPAVCKSARIHVGQTKGRAGEQATSRPFTPPVNGLGYGQKPFLRTLIRHRARNQSVSNPMGSASSLRRGRQRERGSRGIGTGRPTGEGEPARQD